MKWICSFPFPWPSARSESIPTITTKPKRLITEQSPSDSRAAWTENVSPAESFSSVCFDSLNAGAAHSLPPLADRPFLLEQADVRQKREQPISAAPAANRIQPGG